jgi:neutral ceramidase
MIKRIIRSTSVLICCFLVSLMSGFTFYSPENSNISAGTASINITPEVPIPMSGYRSRTNPFEGIHDSIYARAIVFSDGKNKAAIISAEIIGFSNSFCEETFSLIEQEVGIKKEFIQLTVVHNHSGPVTRVYQDDVSPEVIAYAEELQKKLVSLVIEADRGLQPVSMGAGKGECRMNINRRAEDGKGNIQLGRNPYGPCDHEVGVVRIDNAKGNIMSLLLNWPCHAVVMGPRNYFISGDWPGATSRFIEDSLDYPVVSPILIGASGDINPIYGPHIDFVDVNSYAYALEAIGRDLGKEAIRVSRDIKTRSTGTIKAVQKSIYLPGKVDEPNRLHHQGYDPGNDVEVRLSVIKIGDIIFAGVNGEVFNQIGVKLKNQSPYSNTFFLTHCNGSCGYLVSDEAIPKGGYEVSSTSAQSGAETGIIEGFLQMINEVSN